MTTMSKTTTVKLPVGTVAALSGLRAFAGQFGTLAHRRWMSLRNRRQLNYLQELDDHQLRDLGISRLDLKAARTLPVAEDPTRFLASAALHNRHIENGR